MTRLSLGRNETMTPRDLDFHTLDVFTAVRHGGNPLAVVLDADGIGPQEMQRIAHEFNLSETTFVQKATTPDAVFRVRIFTPTQELPFAGHPTVGTACILAELGLAPPGADVSFVLEESVGLVPVRVRRDAGQPAFGELTTAVPPIFGPAAPANEVLARMLGLEATDIGLPGEPARTCTCGVPYVLVPLRQPELLAAIAFDVAVWRVALARAWAQQIYVYARGYEGELRARMFAPGVGVLEDPATGSAAVALVGALALESPLRDGRLEWRIAQGQEMGRPSLLYGSAEKRKGAVTAVRVGGHAVRVSEGRVYR